MLWVLIRIASPPREAILLSAHNIRFYGELRDEAILMSTHNIRFYGELTKIILELSSDTLLICSTETHMNVIQTTDFFMY